MGKYSVEVTLQASEQMREIAVYVAKELKNIDELDAGIFEYMLGELLDIFNKNAKGQLIFTSHNLRALEMLDKESIMFSTANSEKRYIHMKNIKPSNNLRDVYLRGITLGGQDEVIYEATDSLKIARAFRKAGRSMKHSI